MITGHSAYKITKEENNNKIYHKITEYATITNPVTIVGFTFTVVNDFRRFLSHLKHTTTLFSLFDHDILSREWRVVVHLVQTNYHGSPMVL